MHAWFVSDIHIKEVTDQRAVTFLSFVHSLGTTRKATHLYLLGDIFDVWVGHGRVFEQKFILIVEELRKLKQRGVEVIYFEGNHDVFVEKFWGRFNIPVFVGVHNFKINTWNLRLTHGDYINPDDTKYLKWLQIMRSYWMRFLALNLPSRFWYELGQYASVKSRQNSQRYRIDLEDFLREKFRKYAKAESENHDFDFLISGHIHVRDDYVFTKPTGRKVRGINLGSWFNDIKAFYIDELGGSWVEL
jgi:UDP-2,3-diacylglucosamine hydrolase